MKPLWKIRTLAIALIVFFGFGTLVAAWFIATQGAEPHTIFAALTNLGFIAGGVGLWKLQRWSWWLILALCAVSIVHLLWQIFTSLTPETATKQNEIISYVVAGFYLAIALLLTSDSVRKYFKGTNDNAA
jgi:hypothetical protein